jgi:hypothetical protein
MPGSQVAEDAWMLRTARVSLAGRQRKGINWLLIAALVISAFSSVLPSIVQPHGAEAAGRMIKMPFASGSTWRISQGYNTNPTQGGSHYNCPEYPEQGCAPQWMYKYSLDLVRTDGDTAGQAVLSPVNGTIRWIDESYGGMSINLGNGWAVAYFHTVLAPGLQAGQSIVQGQYLGIVAPPGQGGNGGFPHIHITLWQTSDGGNWDRNAKPFTGAQSLDGYDLDRIAGSPYNQYRGTVVSSTNILIGGTIPRQVAQISPAHNTILTVPNVTLNWQPQASATSYQVVVDDGAQTSPWLTGSTWTTNALSTGDHTWRVRARNGVGTGSWSSTWRFWVSTGFTKSELDNGAMIGTGTYRVKGTREGLVGERTSSGHIIVTNDHFVSLPACTTITCDWLTPGTTDPRYGYVTQCIINGQNKCFVIVENPATNTCRVEPVYDRGPWFNVDDYWNPAANRFVNKEIERDGLGYYLAQGYSADAAAFAGYEVGWGKTKVSEDPDIWRGNTNLLKDGEHYPVTFQTAIDIADGTWLELGFPWDPGPQTVVVTMLWQVSTSVATAEAACEGPPPPDPYFTMSKSSGVPGAEITVNGKHYGPNETVRVYLDSSRTTPIASATTGSDGRFTTSFTVPSTVGGPHRIHIVGRTSKLRTAKTFRILPVASINKSSGSANITVNLGGRSFAAGEAVDVFWDGSSTVSAQGTADSGGNVTISDRVPLVNGTHTATLKGRTNGFSARTTFRVIQRVRTTPSSGSAANTITVYGTGWPASTTVTFRWATTTGKILCSDTSNSSGYAQCTFKPPSGASPDKYRIWGSNGNLSASTIFTLMVGIADEPTETPTVTPQVGTPVVSETPPVSETPVASETPLLSPTADGTVAETATPEPENPTETPVPTATEVPTEAPTEVPAPRSAESVAVADTSVTSANPDQSQSGDAIGSLSAGGPDGAITYVSFNVGDIGTGTVTEAYLVLTGSAGGGPGGAIGLVPGYLVDEAGTYQSLPTDGLAASIGMDGSASTVGAVGAGETVWIDVAGSIQADGQYTFVIVGDAAQVLELSSREGGAPPKLVLTIQD